MPKQIAIVDMDFNGNALLNMGEQSISPSAIVTPANFNAQRNNYNPAGLQTAFLLRLTATGGAQNITGITAPNTIRWKILRITNVGNQNIVLVNASANSLAANRFELNANITLASGQGCILYYDQTNLRWRCISRY